MSGTDGASTSMPARMGRLLTVAEVARILRASNMTVYRLVRAGKLPASRIGRSYRIREEDLRRYLQDRFMDAG